MKIFKQFILIVLVGSSLFSCEKGDGLDLKPDTKVLAEDVYSSEVLVDAYVASLYKQFNIDDFNADYIDAFRDHLSGGSDEMTARGGNRTPVTQGTWSRNTESFPYWNYFYIRDLNSFIQNIRTSTIPDAKKTQLEGEVRFLRAYVYFEMERRYGGVPLVDVVIDPYKPVDKKYTRRSTEEAVADFIISELTSITEMLTDNPLPQGRVNKWTALALKARAALWAASIAKYGKVELNGLVGIPASRANEFYTTAAAAADAVIQSGKYSLYNKFPDDKAKNYQNIFLDEENSEVIFEKPYNGIEVGHSIDLWNAPPQFAADGRGGTSNPTLEFLQGYENIDGSTTPPDFGPDHLYATAGGPFLNKDPRLFGTIFFDKDPFAGGFVETYEGIDPSPTPDPDAILSNENESYKGMPQVGFGARTNFSDSRVTHSGFYMKKFLTNEINIQAGMSKTNWIIFRLAEMYLIKAEAQFDLGKLDMAAEALNKTRERAGISLVDAGTITLDKVRTERRSELAFEGHRYWDLRRWRTASNVLNHRFQGLRIIYHYDTGEYYFLPIPCETFTRVFRQANYYNPITDDRINNNPDLIENPLY